MYDKLDGYYTNESYNNHYDKQHATTGNYYLKWIASDNWNVSLNVKHQLARNNWAFPAGIRRGRCFCQSLPGKPECGVRNGG